MAGSVKFTSLALKTNNLMSSQQSENDWRYFLTNSITRQACTATFSGKRIGEDITRIKRTGTQVLFDLTHNEGEFQKNFKIVKMEVTPISGGAIPGRAEWKFYYYRDRAIFERKNMAPCTASDLSGCYKSACQIGLDPSNDGQTGTTVGTCDLLSCGQPETNCYTVESGADKKTLIGCADTQEVAGVQATAVGNNVNPTVNSGRANAFFGTHSASGATVEGNENLFLGSHSGSDFNVSGHGNILMGNMKAFGSLNQSGRISGFKNIIMGSSAGLRKSSAGNTVEIGGIGNTLLGHYAGYNTTIRHNGNTFLGNKAGESTVINAGGQTFIGRKAGEGATFFKDSTDGGYGNVMMGYRAGWKMTAKGKRNVFIGGEVASNQTIQQGHTGMVLIGNDVRALGLLRVCARTDYTDCYELARKDHTHNFPGHDHDGPGGDPPDGGGQSGPGDAGSSSGGTGECGAGDSGFSSRVYKKNIKEFKDHETALNDILNTPLFNYEFKEDFPDKVRMGVISEDLPEHLQLKKEDHPSRPDWPSIHGTFWSGLKAVVSRLEKMLFRMASLEKENKQLKAKLARIQSDLEGKIRDLEQQIEKLKSDK